MGIANKYTFTVRNAAWRKYAERWQPFLTWVLLSDPNDGVLLLALQNKWHATKDPETLHQLLVIFSGGVNRLLKSQMTYSYTTGGLPQARLQRADNSLVILEPVVHAGIPEVVVKLPNKNTRTAPFTLTSVVNVANMVNEVPLRPVKLGELPASFVSDVDKLMQHAL